jgi:hypothetical protein
LWTQKNGGCHEEKLWFDQNVDLTHQNVRFYLQKSGFPWRNGCFPKTETHPGA